MERLRALFESADGGGEYRPIEGSAASESEPGSVLDGTRKRPRVGRLEYAVFVCLGISMLWSWNMFLAAAPYFQTRFADDEYLLANFQSSILTVSTVTNLLLTVALTKMQAKASYPFRVFAALSLNIACFSVLALFTVAFLDVSSQAYFALLMIVVFLTSVATSLCQNGVFAIASGLGVSEYTQAIMTGQGISGVAPCVVQIVSVLSVPPQQSKDGGAVRESPKSAFAYFATATAISGFAWVALAVLLRKSPDSDRSRAPAPADDETDPAEAMASSQLSQRKVVGLWQLFLKLKWLAIAVFLVYAATMQFAVYTEKISSVRDSESAPRLFQRAVFIPLAFLMWNLGDLIGKTAPLVPSLNLVHRQKTILSLSVGRLIFIPLYNLCNVRGRGAVVQSDFFYLVVVQFFFGLSGGWLGATCMMGPSYWADEAELEAAGAFMVLVLVGGLSAGSVISFAVAA